MSFRRTRQYQHFAQQQQGSQDLYNQYEQQGQNGGYPSQYGQAQYPGQPTYGQYPGSQQQAQSPSQDPYGQPQRQPSYTSQYPGQQQQYQYNPQHYAPQPQQQQMPMQQYNPQNYVSANQNRFGAQYNPQHYSPSTAVPGSPIPATATSGPVDPYAYTQTSRPATQPQPQPQGYVQSPQQPYSPRLPMNSYFTQYSPSSPQIYTGTVPSAPPTSQPQTASPPSNDWHPSPHGYNPYGDTGQSPSPLYPASSNISLPSPPSTTQGPTPPTHGRARSDTAGRHPESRPLPGIPDRDDEHDYFYDQNFNRTRLSREEAENISQEELFQQVEQAVRGTGNSGFHSPSISVSQAPADSNGPSARPPIAPNSPNLRPDRSNSNGSLQPVRRTTDYHYSSDSDAEAAQGLAWMQQADEDDARQRQSGSGHTRFGSGYGSQRGSSSQQQYLMPHREASDSDDYGGVDMSSYGGGYDVHMTYGGDPNVLAVGGDINGYDPYSQPVSSQHSSMRRSHASQSSQASRFDYDYNLDSIHPFRPFDAPARVDAGGTGGLSEPTADGRRQSYDEGDEYAFMDGGMPDRFPDEPPDIFYRPASTSWRPLPTPPEGEYPTPLQTNFRDPSPQPPYPTDPDGFAMYNQQDQWVPRSTSLLHHSTTPQVYQPLRSKTDAEERRLKQQQQQGRKSDLSAIEGTPSTMTPAIDLPSLPGKRFMPSQLGAPAFKKCEEPWSLMSILKWLLQVTNPEQVTELKEADVKEALVALFTNKVPTMNIADAETLSNRVVQDMYDAETLITTEEWVKIVPGIMEGVIFQLTGSGCYSPTLHDHVIPGRCYAHHCQRTLKKVNLQGQPKRTSENWAEFYGLKKEDYEGQDKKDLERQYMLHEIVQTEEMYMEQLAVLRTVYCDPLDKIEPSIIAPKRKDKFIQQVFGKLDAIKQANEDHLLPQLKYRQQEQGPWIVGFSDIFRQWIRKAKAAYIEYAAGFPHATFLVRQEIDRNLEFRNYIERARNDKRSMKLGWDTFLKAPITRLQRYTLLLTSVLKTMKTESEEKTNLKIAYDEVKAVTLECDARVAENQRKVDLMDLQQKLVLRPGMQNAVELNLDSFGRELIHRGDLQRMGANKFTWLDSHGLLFDHYLVLTKTIAQRSDQGGKVEKYDVSRLPIPMDLLILESKDDPAVQKSSYMKGITTMRDVGPKTAPAANDPNAISRTASSSSPGPPTHTNTAASGTSTLHPVTSLAEGKDADKIVYPFKVKHLGRDTYTLFAATDQVRKEWCSKILEAKTKHAAALYNQNAEPFKLRVMADAGFVLDGASPASKAPVIRGTPVDRAIKEVEQKFKDPVRPAPVCRARVNCATTFSTPHPENTEMVAIGTDFGVYISEMSNPRGYRRAIPLTKVTQVAVLEEFNLFLLISDKTLLAYHLDTIFTNNNNTTSGNDSTAKAPRKLSGSKDVGFFVMGRIKDRTLLFYKKRETTNSVFKVMEPIYQKSTEKKRGIFKRGNFEFFREYDEFYIPAECGGMNLFHSSLAVSTARGFEVLTLDKKQPWSVPELRAPHVQNIASHIKDQKALAMLRLSDQEFLLVYGNCAVYVNKHGDVSRSVIMEFVGNAESAALYGAYLILFNNDFVEIRNAQNGRLKQIIAAREIKCLDDGGTWTTSGSHAGANGTANGVGGSGRSVKFVMQHHESANLQIVVELLLNENMKE